MDGFVNKRALEIWDIIIPHVDFRDKTVVDIGCGPADFIRLALGTGAKHVSGIDMDYAIMLDASAVLKGDKRKAGRDFTLLCDDLNTMVTEHNLDFAADIAICFSCLPYLDDFTNALAWISELSGECALIESQYAGDGPGPRFLSGDDDMADLLSHYWGFVGKLGETDTRIRAANRSVWLCKGA